MTMPHKASVIMVTRNTGKSLARAVGSVLAQGPDIELVLVNNGNPPQVEAQLVEKFKDDPHVRLMTGHGDVGLAKGRNLGARVATGERLLFLADDCVLPEGAVKALMREAEGLERPFLLGARIVGENGTEDESARQNLFTPTVALVEALFLAKYFPRYRRSLRTEPLPPKTAEIPAVSGAAMLVDGRDFELFGGFNEEIDQGPVAMDLCLRCARAKGKVYVTPCVDVTRLTAMKKPFDVTQEKQRLIGTTRYFLENFGHLYPQPFLWLIDALLAVRLAIGRVLKNSGIIIPQ